MVNVSDTLKEAQSKKLMTEALTEKYGNLDNTEEVEWVVFKGQSVANIWGGDPNAQGGARPNDKFSVTAKITVEAGEKEMTFNSAVFVCQDEGLYAYTGFGQKDPNEEYLLSETKTVKVEAKPDYSSAVEVSPAGVSAGDYICITFDAAETPLKGAEVTLVATATLADGSTKTADAVKMEKQSGDKFFKYLYPKSLFGADNIKGIKVNFKAGETVVTSVDEEGFVVL